MMTSTLILKTSKQHLTIRHVGRSASHAGYNPRKAAQVVAYFALRSGTRSIDADKAAMLAYLADRESIKLFGSPILNEPRSSHSCICHSFTG